MSTCWADACGMSVLERKAYGHEVLDDGPKLCGILGRGGLSRRLGKELEFEPGRPSPGPCARRTSCHKGEGGSKWTRPWAARGAAAWSSTAGPTTTKAWSPNGWSNKNRSMARSPTALVWGAGGEQTESPTGQEALAATGSRAGGLRSEAHCCGAGGRGATLLQEEAGGVGGGETGCLAATPCVGRRPMGRPVPHRCPPLWRLTLTIAFAPHALTLSPDAPPLSPTHSPLSLSLSRSFHLSILNSRARASTYTRMQTPRGASCTLTLSMKRWGGGAAARCNCDGAQLQRG